MRPGESGYLRHQGVDLHLIKDIDGLMAMKRWASERRPVMGVDTETTGLSPERDRIRLIQIGDQHTGWAIPWDDWAGGALELISTYEGPIVLANSKFDIRHLAIERPGFEWPWHQTHDVLTMAHLVDPLRPKGLKSLASRLVDPQAVAGERALNAGMKEHKWTWETVPIDFPPYWIYAALDPVLTCHVYDRLKPEVDELYHDPYDLEMAVTRIVSGMEELGMRVNPSYLTTKRTELLDYVKQAKEWLIDAYRLDRPTPLGLVKFFTEQGVPMLDKKTKSGNQAMDKEVLESIDHPVAEVVLKIRQAEKLVGTYLDNLLELRDEHDRVHPNFWTMGTRTGRMTIQNPALQTLPKRDVTVRSGFIPSEGYSIISFDADQIEARLMAHFSGSQPMIDALTGEDDFFLTMASQVFGVPVTDKGDSRRQLMKGVTYGRLYGGQAETLAEVAGIEVSKMHEVLGAFDRAYPEIRRLMSSLGKDGWVRTPTGRRLAVDDGKEYTATNYLIQGHAAEILKRNVVNLDATLPDEVRLMLLVHDEIVMEAPTEMVPELMPLIKDTLDDFETYAVPITWGGEATEISWGAMLED